MATPTPAPEVQSTPTPPTEQAITKARTSRSLIVFLLFVFPPVAWILMAKDKSYHHWLIKVLYVSGIISLLLLALFYFSVGIQIDQLYAALDMQQSMNINVLYATMITGGVVAALQILFAFIFHLYLRKHQSLTKLQIAIIIILLIAAFVVAFIPPIITIESIYSLTLSI